MVQQWVKNFVEAHIVDENLIVNEKEYKPVREPKKGDVVWYRAWQEYKIYQTGEILYNPGDTFLVQITGGYYWGEHGISNFWYWVRVDETGKPLEPLKKEWGYGNFFKSGIIGRKPMTEDYRKALEDMKADLQAQVDYRKEHRSIPDTEEEIAFEDGVGIGIEGVLSDIQSKLAIDDKLKEVFE